MSFRVYYFRGIRQDSLYTGNNLTQGLQFHFKELVQFLNKKFQLKLKQLEGKVNENTIDIKTLFEAFRKLMNPVPAARNRIGFKK